MEIKRIRELARKKLDRASIDNMTVETGRSATSDKKQNRFIRLNYIKLLWIICVAGFLIFLSLIVNEKLLQPWRAARVINHTRDLYHNDQVLPNVSATPAIASITAVPIITPEIAPELTPNPSELTPELMPGLSPDPIVCPTKDELGRLLQFRALLSSNPDTKGWINYPDTNIDYAVMQKADNPEYYLSHDFNGEKQKAGCLFLDPQSCVESNTKNLVIHGHNMKSTDNMFHYLEHMRKDIEYFKLHTVFRFDTIYQTGQWKVISVFITNGSDKNEPFFNYMKSTFRDSSEFMDFVYQLRIRSIYDLNQVDINENDQLCMLSTCSYELDNYRLVIVARKVREGEAASLDAELIKKNSEPLYPQSYYENYGGTAPKLPKTFEEALEQGSIPWYKPGDK